MVNISAMLLAMGVLGGERHTSISVDGLNMPDFQEHIKGPFTGRLWQPGDAGHFGNVEKIFEIMRFIHEEPVNAEFLKGQRIVLPMICGQSFEPGFQTFLGLFQLF